MNLWSSPSQTARKRHAVPPNLLRNGRGESNRTFHLLGYDLQPISQWFQRFPKQFREQELADLGEVVP